MREPRSEQTDEHGERGDLRVLIETLAQAEDETIRVEAARAMGESGNGRCVQPLIAALDDDVGGVRRAALKALRRIERAGDMPEGAWQRVESLLEKRLFFFDRQEVTVPDFDCEGFVLERKAGPHAQPRYAGIMYKVIAGVMKRIGT